MRKSRVVSQLCANLLRAVLTHSPGRLKQGVKQMAPQISMTVDDWWRLRVAARCLTGNERVAAYSTLWQLFTLLDDEDKVEAQRRWAYGHTSEQLALH